MKTECIYFACHVSKNKTWSLPVENGANPFSRKSYVPAQRPRFLPWAMLPTGVGGAAGKPQHIPCSTCDPKPMVVLPVILNRLLLYM